MQIKAVRAFFMSYFKVLLLKRERCQGNSAISNKGKLKRAEERLRQLSRVGQGHSRSPEVEFDG
jgi:hypothetical protein